MFIDKKFVSKKTDGKRIYGDWAGNMAGYKENINNCIAEVVPNDRGGWAWRYQCNRKRGFGYRGLFCKQHAKIFNGF